MDGTAAYEAAVARAQLGLQVSFAESYCYVAAEHLLAGVPVGSAMVPALDALSPALRERLIVSSPEAVDEIREKLQFLIDRRATARRSGRRARDELLAANARDAEREAHPGRSRGRETEWG